MTDHSLPIPALHLYNLRSAPIGCGACPSGWEFPGGGTVGPVSPSASSGAGGGAERYRERRWGPPGFGGVRQVSSGRYSAMPPCLGHWGLTGYRRPSEGSRRGSRLPVSDRFLSCRFPRAAKVQPWKGPGLRCWGQPGCYRLVAIVVPQFSLSRCRAGDVGSSRRSPKGRAVAEEPGLTGGGDAWRWGRARGGDAAGEGPLLPPGPWVRTAPHPGLAPPLALPYTTPAFPRSPHLPSDYFWACGSPQAGTEPRGLAAPRSPHGMRGQRLE